MFEVKNGSIDNDDLHEMREDVHAAGECPALAELLSGVQGEGNA